MSDVPTVELVEQLRRANAGLRDVLTAREAESAELRAENAELRALVHALGLQVAELQRRTGSGSDDSGTPSKESIEAKARRKAERQARREQQEQGGNRGVGRRGSGRRTRPRALSQGIPDTGRGGSRTRTSSYPSQPRPSAGAAVTS